MITFLRTALCGVAAGICSAAAFTQSTLEVHCYTNNTLYNAIYVDGNIVEYGCINDPAFYVAVFAPDSCTPWKTNFDGNGYDFGNAVTGRPRAESYFVFRYADSSELAGMNMLLTTLPANHPVVIYTPVSYDPGLVSSVSPELAQTLETNWGTVVQDTQIMILYGIEDQPGTFVSDVTINSSAAGDRVAFSTILSCNASAGITGQSADQLVVLYTGNGQLQITAPGMLTDIALIDLGGRKLPAIVSGNVLTAANGLPLGSYIVCGRLNGQVWWRRVTVSW